MAMAAQLLEEKLTCAICLERFRAPVTLPCGHSFCRACIQDSEDRCGAMCPVCREPFPAAGQLRRSVVLSGVLEALPAGAPAAPGPAPRPDAADPGARCPRHGRRLELFCRTEGRCACCACTVSECRGHELALLDAERRAREVQMRATLEVCRQQATQAETQLRALQEQSSHIESSACSLASVVSSKFSCLLQALKMLQDLALRDIETAKAQALDQARDEERRLRGHQEAWAGHSCRTQALLDQQDDYTFLQESQLLVPPEPLGPLTLPQWDGDQQLGHLKETLSQLGGLLLKEEGHPGASAEATASGPVEAPGPLAPVPNPVCPLRQQLWQNYRNLTFDPDSANRHLYVSLQNQQVKHRCRPRPQAGPGSFEFWQVQCTQSFRTGRHYWELHTSSHSVTLGMAYPELARRKLGPHTDNIGRGPCSWGLCIQEDGVQAWHNGKTQRLRGAPGRLLGMDLDVASGCLTFYSLEPQVQPLHTFHAVFTQPLYPVFWLLEGRTLTLRHLPGATFLPEPPAEASGLN
ncbi:E3 ubiquitin-protein ligase TRIM65 isoform X1 [Dasypus novemcinctus]|uniref:E3 ubiquitin-protein ligase TRIM65 isoform X1 n=1 Tax=Dasypus novemcinctus TaxID=9361 RepID=UPI00265E8908|nr:E3 ubiquitin-protein ligase TRIM65 isoform X1 [Dasypus novemcinctus]